MNKKDFGVVIYLFIYLLGKMWFKTLIIMFYVNYSEFMWPYGKMNAHQLKNFFFIHKAFVFKVICLFFFLPSLMKAGFEDHYK